LVIGDILFFRQDHLSVSNVVRNSYELLAQEVEKYPEREFDKQSDHEAVSALAIHIMIEPINLNYDSAIKKAEEITVTRRNEFGDVFETPGLRVTKTFSFSGDRNLWNIGIGKLSSSMPKGSVGNGTITIGMEVPHNNGKAAADHIISTVEQIERYLKDQNETLARFNADLPSRLLPLVQARRSRRSNAEQLLGDF